MVDAARRDQVLAALTGLDIDGAYVVAEAPRNATEKSQHLRGATSSCPLAATRSSCSYEGQRAVYSGLSASD